MQVRPDNNCQILFKFHIVGLSLYYLVIYEHIFFILNVNNNKKITFYLKVKIRRRILKQFA